MSGILSGSEIRRAVADGRIEIEPFREEQLNPVSYDLRLGRGVRFYASNAHVGASFVLGAPPQWAPLQGSNLDMRGEYLDAAEDNDTHYIEMEKNEPFLLKPGIGYLMHTEERIRTNVYVPVLDGKSSIGRLFISIHQTAGYGDPGFNGQYTMEVTVAHPVIVYSGMLIAQMRFHTIVGEVVPYAGNYTGEAARGPVASKSWKQFEKRSKL